MPPGFGMDWTDYEVKYEDVNVLGFEEYFEFKLNESC